VDESLHPVSTPRIVAETYEGSDGSTIHVLSLTGEFDLAVASVLRDELLERLNAIPRAVVVHLGGVTFIDSSILGALVVAARRARELGVALRLAEVPSVVTKLLRLTAMSRFFTIHPNLGTALGASPERADPKTRGRSIDRLDLPSDRPG
jgi:anti-sigma B factor antagonist